MKFFNNIIRWLHYKTAVPAPKRPQVVCQCGKTITQKKNGELFKHKCTEPDGRQITTVVTK